MCNSKETYSYQLNKSSCFLFVAYLQALSYCFMCLQIVWHKKFIFNETCLKTFYKKGILILARIQQFKMSFYALNVSKIGQISKNSNLY